jgi:hypothetical protein
MIRHPDRTAEQKHGVAHPEPTRGNPLDVSPRREHRHRGESRMTADRRWRFTDAVTAARQLSAGNAGG